jgi:hypothetical protein
MIAFLFSLVLSSGPVVGPAPAPATAATAAPPPAPAVVATIVDDDDTCEAALVVTNGLTIGARIEGGPTQNQPPGRLVAGGSIRYHISTARGEPVVWQIRVSFDDGAVVLQRGVSVLSPCIGTAPDVVLVARRPQLVEGGRFWRLLRWKGMW